MMLKFYRLLWVPRLMMLKFYRLLWVPPTHDVEVLQTVVGPPDS